MIISLDTECTGLDLVHGTRPFLVTTCSHDGTIRYWEWDVCPLTRQPEIPSGDLAEIAELVDAAELIYLQNSKFDVRALATVGVDLPWHKVRDTLAMGHLLASNHRHDLASMCVEYLGVDIEPHELHVKEVVRECRKTVKQGYPQWRIAVEGAWDMPSVKESGKRDEDKPWKNDMWLPRALLKQRGTEGIRLEDVNRLSTACSRYANADSEHTLYLGLEMERLIRERGLWAIYEHRLQLPQVACEMETYGLTAIGGYTESAVCQYEQHVAEAEDALVDIAAGYGHHLELAQGAALNDNMRDFFYGSVVHTCPRCTYSKRVKHWNVEGEAHWMGPPTCPKCGEEKKDRKGNVTREAVRQEMVVSRRTNLGLPVITSPKTHNATLDADAMQEYLLTLEGPAYEFVRLLADKRGYDTALTYMAAYRRFWVAVVGMPGYYRIHGSLNPFATDHLRWASNSPNMQNISVGGDDGELSLRECFGPLPDREWWNMDFKNLEKRIPAYEAGEPKLIEIFESPDSPPYWGSDHNLIASLLFPEEFWPLAETNGFKTAHPRKYKRCKNTNFAKQYGAGKRKTAATAGVEGAYDLIDRGLPELAKLQLKYLRLAERTGWVETLPDRTVDPSRGYPILASRKEDGQVLSTTPFNYHVSGTACWVKNTSLIRCADQCRRWRGDGFDAWVALEVHDSILFDFPQGATMEENLPRVLVLKELMEKAGDDLIPRVPTPVSVEYHIHSWAEGLMI